MNLFEFIFWHEMHELMDVIWGAICFSCGVLFLLYM